MNEWLLTFLIIYGVISIYYGIVNSFAVQNFEEIMKELPGSEKDDRKVKAYFSFLPLIMAVLSIFWPLFLVIKSIVKITFKDEKEG